MLDANVVEEYPPEVACIRRFFVVEQHNFDMRGLVVPGEIEACTLGACLVAEGCWRGFVAVEGVVGQALQVSRQHFDPRHRSRHYQPVLVHSNMPIICE
jgi:hypothetical protein